MLPGAGQLQAEVGAGAASHIGGKEQLVLAMPHFGGLQVAATAQELEGWQPECNLWPLPLGAHSFQRKRAPERSLRPAGLNGPSTCKT